MKYRKCDFCGCEIDDEHSNHNGSSCGQYDLCDPCTLLARRGTCKKCKGRGRVQVVDEQATRAQASCGENRTQYKSIECNQCS